LKKDTAKSAQTFDQKLPGHRPETLGATFEERHAFQQHQGQLRLWQLGDLLIHGNASGKVAMGSTKWEVPLGAT